MLVDGPRGSQSSIFQSRSTMCSLAADEPRLSSAPIRSQGGAARLTINWVIAPLGKGSGGHHTIMRFASVTSRCAATRATSSFTTAARAIQTVREARLVTQRHFPPMKARVCGVEEIGDADILIATAWQTAYPVFKRRTRASKFYFVQGLRALDSIPWYVHTLAERIRIDLDWRASRPDRGSPRSSSASSGCARSTLTLVPIAGRYRFENPARRNKVLSMPGRRRLAEALSWGCSR